MQFGYRDLHRSTVYQTHRIVGTAIGSPACGINRHNVWMLEVASDSGFRFEALHNRSVVCKLTL